MFKEGTKVAIYNVPTMEGMRGTITGYSVPPNSYIAGFGAYIIAVDKEYYPQLRNLGYDYTSIVMTDACVREL